MMQTTAAPARSASPVPGSDPRAAPAVLPPEQEMYRALVERDASYDGVFVACVRTTGIFCRPGCGARKPRAEHVEYFAVPSDALHAGYRPCRRCRPLDGGARPPAWVQRVLDAVEASGGERMTDADLRSMDVEPARARRHFKTRYGMTFHAYQRARRMGRALASVRAGDGATSAGLASGYESTSGFRDAFARLFGCPPGRSDLVRCLQATWIDTPLGAMVAAADDAGLCLLEFVDRRGLEHQVLELRRRLRAVIVPGPHPLLEQARDELRAYFDGRLTAFRVPIQCPGTPWQTAVWDRLLGIPHGAVRSYAALAEALGRPGAARAVGRANGANRLAIIVPCHRVVRSDGSLCGYGGGRWRKQRLLELEGARVARAGA